MDKRMNHSCGFNRANSSIIQISALKCKKGHDCKKLSRPLYLYSLFEIGYLVIRIYLLPFLFCLANIQIVKSVLVYKYS